MYLVYDFNNKYKIHELQTLNNGPVFDPPCITHSVLQADEHAGERDT